MSKEILLAEMSQEQLLAHATAQAEKLAKAEATIKGHEATIAGLIEDNKSKEKELVVVGKPVVEVGKKVYTLKVPKSYLKVDGKVTLISEESIKAEKAIAKAALEAGLLKEVTNA